MRDKLIDVGKKYFVSASEVRSVDFRVYRMEHWDGSPDPDFEPSFGVRVGVNGEKDHVSSWPSGQEAERERDRIVYEVNECYRVMLTVPDDALITKSSEIGVEKDGSVVNVSELLDRLEVLERKLSGIPEGETLLRKSL